MFIFPNFRSNCLRPITKQAAQQNLFPIQIFAQIFYRDECNLSWSINIYIENCRKIERKFIKMIGRNLPTWPNGP